MQEADPSEIGLDEAVVYQMVTNDIYLVSADDSYPGIDMIVSSNHEDRSLGNLEDVYI